MTVYLWWPLNFAQEIDSIIDIRTNNISISIIASIYKTLKPLLSSVWGAGAPEVPEEEGQDHRLNVHHRHRRPLRG